MSDKINSDRKIIGQFNPRTRIELDRTEELRKRYVHFAIRLKERYGLDITPDEYLELCRSKRTIIYMQSKAVKVVTVDFKGQTILAVFQKAFKYLRTASPIENLSKYEVIECPKCKERAILAERLNFKYDAYCYGCQIYRVGNEWVDFGK